jgi:hypothetical protein
MIVPEEPSGVGLGFDLVVDMHHGYSTIGMGEGVNELRCFKICFEQKLHACKSYAASPATKYEPVWDLLKRYCSSPSAIAADFIFQYKYEICVFRQCYL